MNCGTFFQILYKIYFGMLIDWDKDGCYVNVVLDNPSCYIFIIYLIMQLLILSVLFLFKFHLFCHVFSFHPNTNKPYCLSSVLQISKKIFCQKRHCQKIDHCPPFEWFRYSKLFKVLHVCNAKFHFLLWWSKKQLVPLTHTWMSWICIKKYKNHCAGIGPDVNSINLEFFFEVLLSTLKIDSLNKRRFNYVLHGHKVYWTRDLDTRRNLWLIWFTAIVKSFLCLH